MSAPVACDIRSVAERLSNTYLHLRQLGLLLLPLFRAQMAERLDHVAVVLCSVGHGCDRFFFVEI